LKSLKDGYISKVASENITDLELSSENVDQEESEKNLYLEPIPWYPEEFAWNSNLSRRFIRRSEVLRKLHRFLVEDSECGAITRQEAVSMIPPMLLDVQSHHLVLDMCAAPGSKTAQIIEMMHSTCDTNAVPTGAVLANDADHKRCYMLTHQAKRLNTPCVVITNHDASIFPKLHSADSDGNRNVLEFNRVLCDVPCSGDGTIRKNPLLWHKWSPHLGNALHRLQMRILIRGLELLKVGGRLVYSTCSFNPIENEAVIASVLKQSNHSVELVDCSKDIPLLKRIPGKKYWSVFDRHGKEIEQFEESLSKTTDSLKETMFPPTKEIADDINLERCMRIYPHLQNTGGFFIAVLEKKSELPWQKTKRAWKSLPWDESNTKITKEEEKKGVENAVLPKESLVTETDDVLSQPDDEEIQQYEVEPDSPPTKKVCSDEVEPEEPIDTESNEADVAPQNLKIKRGVIKEDPYIFLDDTDQDLADIRKFYGLSSELASKQFLVRSTGAIRKRHIYLVSENVHRVMSENKHIKIINTGVRVVTRSPFRAGKADHGLEYRLVQDGLQLVHGFLKNRIIQVTLPDLIALVSQYETKMAALNQETQTEMEKTEMGCVVWHYDVSTATESDPLSSDLWLCGHKGRNSAQVMLNKEERKHYLRILGVPIPEDLEQQIKGPNWGDQPKKTDKSTEEEVADLTNDAGIEE